MVPGVADLLTNTGALLVHQGIAARTSTVYALSTHYFTYRTNSVPKCRPDLPILPLHF